MRLYPLIFVLLAGLSIAPSMAADAPQNAEAPAAIFIVRHAEKEVGEHVGRDPQLTEAGQERAEALVDLLDGAGIDAIYVTQWRRTQQTAAPVAKALDMPPRILQTDEGFEARLAERIRREHAGDIVLVVGHSNTNPTLIQALGAEPPTIRDDDYDDVYQVVFPASPSGEAHLVRLGYGRPTP